MILQNNDYEITHRGTPYESIEISKTALERLRDHYHEVGRKLISPEMKMFYAGKIEVIVDMLKHFEELEVL